MSLSGARSEPTISAGSLADTIRCHFKLNDTLLGDPPKNRKTDPSMRLWNAIVEALRIAHERSYDEGSDLETSIRRSGGDASPSELSAEEGAVYRDALRAYIDAFDDSDVPRMVLHPKAHEPLRRTVNTNPSFALTGRADLLFAFDDRPPLVRRIRLRGAEFVSDVDENGEDGNDVGAPSIPDLALAALLGVSQRNGPPARNDVVLRSETLQIRNGHVTEGTVSLQQLDRFRATLNDAVTDAVSDPSPKPGWWCSSCRVVNVCPAIASRAVATLISQITE